MTLTGGSADLWMPIKPGTEGVMALGIANLLLNKLKMSDAGIPIGVREMINEYDVTSVGRITGVAGHRIQRIAALLQERSPSLVLAGATVEGHTHGYASVAPECHSRNWRQSVVARQIWLLLPRLPGVNSWTQ